ncbi:hypothetical protein J2Z20_000807 [Paenibacillus sediminis]|uniref:Paeninodin family lasso peptide n=1 Tax=Paenibacillus sediminis TaxID=664909 RepID=A0ABS4H0G8_9BACL|nr:hypothetical protein [Paenibacillus sediminis]
MTQKFSDPESGWTTDLQNGVSLNELVNCCSNDE